MIWQLVCLVSRQNILTKVLISNNNNNNREMICLQQFYNKS